MNEQSVELRGEVDPILEMMDALYFKLQRILGEYIGVLTEDEIVEVFDNVMDRLTR